jgi:hypothetical protein
MYRYAGSFSIQGIALLEISCGFGDQAAAVSGRLKFQLIEH